MTTTTPAQQVFSDREFNCDAPCCHCERPVRRDEGVRRVHPALAIATDDTGYDFALAPTLCSDCLHSNGLDDCALAAMDRASDLDCQRYRYQLVGDPDGQEALAEFIEMAAW